MPLVAQVLGASENVEASRGGDELNLEKYQAARYREVHALLINWEEDDANVQGELLALEETLGVKYAVVTHHIAIPSEESDLFLETELDNFKRRYSAADVLCIVYYAGHGCLGPDLRLNWVAYVGPHRNQPGQPSPRLDWTRHQLGLENQKSDVLILLNCCFSAGSAIAFAPPLQVAQQCGVVEIIAVCGFGNEAPGPGPHSFTNSLIYELNKMAVLPYFSVGALFRRVLARLATGERGSTSTPVHISMSTAMPYRSITLMPFDAASDKWGPLGPLPEGWEMDMDNGDGDGLWEPYYCDNNTGQKYWTRPLYSVCPKALGSTWDQNGYVAGLVLALGRDLMMSQVEDTSSDNERFTAASSCAEWVSQLRGPDGVALAPRVRNAPNRRLRARTDNRGKMAVAIDW